MLRARSLALLALGAASASSCVQPGQPAALARADHALFWSPTAREEALLVGDDGGVWQHGALDAERHPGLAEAWQRGAAPRAPLYGRDPGVHLRTLRAYPPEQPGGAWRLDARALAPYPIRLTVLADQGGVLAPVARDESEMWNRRSHFARAEASVRLPDGALVAVRVEGAHQAFESLLRLRAAQ